MASIDIYSSKTIKQSGRLNTAQKHFARSRTIEDHTAEPNPFVSP